MVYGYWLYCCPICDDIWCGEDPLLKEADAPCGTCGIEVESGWVEEYDDETEDGDFE